MIREAINLHAQANEIEMAAVSNYMTRGKGHSSQDEGVRKINSDGLRRGDTVHHAPPKEREYIDSNDISKMFEFTLAAMPDTDSDKSIVRSMYGDFRAYERLTIRQYHRLKKNYFGYEGPEINIEIDAPK